MFHLKRLEIKPRFVWQRNLFSGIFNIFLFWIFFSKSYLGLVPLGFHKVIPTWALDGYNWYPQTYLQIIKINESRYIAFFVSSDLSKSFSQFKSVFIFSRYFFSIYVTRSKSVGLPQYGVDFTRIVMMRDKVWTRSSKLCTLKDYSCSTFVKFLAHWCTYVCNLRGRECYFF